jgi:hypothetical protein
MRTTTEYERGLRADEARPGAQELLLRSGGDVVGQVLALMSEGRALWLYSGNVEAYRDRWLDGFAVLEVWATCESPPPDAEMQFLALVNAFPHLWPLDCLRWVERRGAGDDPETVRLRARVRALAERELRRRGHGSALANGAGQ